MLFYLNAYTSSNIIPQYYRNKILIAANNAVIEYKSHNPFSTLFFTQHIPNELNINKQLYIKYLRKSLKEAIVDKIYNYDYIGECIEQIIYFNKSIDKKYITMLLHNNKKHSHHNLVTASIVPFSNYLQFKKK